MDLRFLIFIVITYGVVYLFFVMFLAWDKKKCFKKKFNNFEVTELRDDKKENVSTPC